MVTQRGKNGRWYARLEMRNEQGRRVQKWVALPNCKTRGDAVEAERKLKDQVKEAGEIAADPGRQTLAVYLRSWLEGRASISPKTRETYKHLIEGQIIPALGHHRLGQLKKHNISNAYRTMEGRISARSITHCHRILRLALKHAVEQEILTRNPADGAERPSVEDKEMLALDERQVNRLLALVTGNRLEIPVRLAVFCGLRRGEALALRWVDLDLDEGTLAVRRSLEQTKGNLRFKSPKTRKPRVVAIPPSLVDVLRRHRESMPADRELVVCREDGLPMTPNALTSAFRHFIARTDLPRCRFHDLRHTSATLLLKQRVPVKVVSQRLGHSTTKLTLDVYGHVLKGMDEEAARGFDAALLAAEDV